MNYYNEHDSKTAAWLRELIKQRAIPDGIVDERSIVDVRTDDLQEYTQCHFFAGIGGWPYALQLAGWSENQRVWTGSCPCQPFSTAGGNRGINDERHLWPVFATLIRECQPTIVFGEQVESAIAHGWVDLVRSDLENSGYAYANAGLIASGVGAPQSRKRIYFVANRLGARRSGLEQGKNSSLIGQWNWRGKKDLQSLAEEPFTGTDRWPQPLLRQVDDGLSSRVASLHGYGNAIVPQLAAKFIQASVEAMNDQP